MPSNLLISVLQANGIGQLPSDEEISNMSDEEKQELSKRQKQAIVDFREKSRHVVENLRATVELRMATARQMGLSSALNTRWSQSQPDSILLEAPTVVQTVEPKPLLAPAPVKAPRQQKRSVNTFKSSGDLHQMHFYSIDKRIREINREITVIMKRFKNLEMTAPNLRHGQPWR